MPIKNYGVWVARAVRVSAERAEQDPKSPHIHLHYKNQENDSEEFRASINVKSLSEISELVFWFIPNFQHPIVNKLPDLNRGFQQIPSRAGGVALDYIRGNLMDFQSGRILPHDLPEERDDIIDYVMPELQSAIERNATVYLFGEPYSDKKGIHNVHMNQGSVGRFTRDNGVWQDGGIIMHFSEENRFAAIFLAFASQAVHTDEVKGNALPGSLNFAQLLSVDIEEEEEREERIADDLRVAIIAALVNPVGSENQRDNNDESTFVILRQIRGRIISRPRNQPFEFKARGRQDWVGWAELRTSPVNEIAIMNTGRVIRDVDADILAVVEAENRGAPPGRYRSFLFGFSPPDRPMTQSLPSWSDLETVRDLIRRGNRLPVVSSLSSVRAAGYVCYIFVYEYERKISY
jgi:uncharacterized protein YukJ